MNTTKSQLRLSIFFMLSCGALWSLAGLFTKSIPWDTMVIVSLRSVMAGFVLYLFMRVTKRRVIVNKHSLLAGFMLMMTFITFVEANKKTTAANAIALQFTAPLFIMIINRLLFKQKGRRQDMIAVGITLLGVSLFFYDKLDAGNMWGNIVAIISGLFMACMYISTSRADGDCRMSGLLIGNIMAAVCCAPFVFIQRPEFGVQPVILIILMGIFELGIPYVLYGLASRHCSPLMCSLLAVIEPLLSPVWVFLSLGETPGVFAFAGGIIIIGTITVWCIWTDRRSEV